MSCCGSYKYAYFRRERLCYYERRAHAASNPSEALSVIIDAMDQAKTNLPHFEGWETSKVNVDSIYKFSLGEKGSHPVQTRCKNN